MVEPITIFIAVTSFLSLLSTGIDWIKKRMDSQSVSPVPLVIATSTVSFSTSIDENIRSKIIIHCFCLLVNNKKNRS